MGSTGTLFGWAFGDSEREDDQSYVDGLKREALANATQAARSKGFDVAEGSAVFTVLSAGDALVDIDTAPDDLVVRCTVKLVGEGSERIHAEGPMNG
ncbi:hypothetical protein [Arthrobacter sp. NPDC056727]|uniref:hypothetical protein n=1 Tax=Arthrobacter sp. NPDC056727 TaxID=3345927 RepID=UPI00366CF7BA